MDRCVNCGIATSRCNTLVRRALDDVTILSVIRRWRAPQPVNSSDYVCQACWNLAQESYVEAQQLGHRSVCLRCGCSLASRVSHLLNIGSPRELRIYNVILECIMPRTIEVTSCICHKCWVAADRAATRMISGPSTSSQGSSRLLETYQIKQACSYYDDHVRGKTPEITHFENTDEVLSISRSNSPTQSECEQNAEAILYPACNICKENIIGLRYVCVQCSNWDMCESCEASGAHDHHYVLRLPRTNDVPRNHLDDLIQSIQQKLALLQTEIKTECLMPDEEEATLHDSEMITFKDEPQDYVAFLPPEEAVVPTAIPSSTNTPEPADSNSNLITTKYISFDVPPTKNEQTLKPTASKIVKKLKHARSRKINTAVCCEDNLENNKSKVKKKMKRRTMFSLN